MGFEHFKISKAGAPFRHGTGKAVKPRAQKRDSTAADPSCATGAFYTSPTLGQTVDSIDPLNIVWQPSLNCLVGSPTYVDIYLDSPGASSPLLHRWQGVPYSTGNYTVDLVPGWWNSTSSVKLQVMVVPTGTPPFLSTIPAGAVFQASYTTNGTTAPAADTSVTSGATTVVTATQVSGISSHKLSKGKTAAAVLLPLLFVILLGIAYVKLSRMRGAAKRSEWSEKLDKRMSTISADWKSITAGGAKEAVRQSMAQRNSSAFSFGAIRPGNVEGEPVVMGEKPLPLSRGSIDIDEKDLPRTSLGSGVGVGVGARRPRTHANPPERGSRAVSFADAAHPRPSMSSAYSRGSRAFHTASTYNDFADGEAPPVPALPSPSQTSAYAGSRERKSSASSGNRIASVYNANGTAWSSGERVEGVDGGFGARSVSPTGRVHTINYPSPSSLAAAAGHDAFDYGDANDSQGSYFSPVTPTPNNTTFGVYEPSHDSAYAATTFGEYTHPAHGSPSESEISSGLPSGMTSPRQTAGPLTLTPDDIRRRMTMQHGQNSDGAWRQSVDEVFGALSMMRTGGEVSEAEEEGGDYLFAPVQETVFAYPGTPAASSFNSTHSAMASPFSMPMSAPMASPDEMLRHYAAKHASVASTVPSPLSNSTTGAEVVSGIQNTGMRVLYAQPGASGAAAKPARAPTLLRAGKGARLSK